MESHKSTQFASGKIEQTINFENKFRTFLKSKFLRYFFLCTKNRNQQSNFGQKVSPIQIGSHNEKNLHGFLTRRTEDPRTVHARSLYPARTSPGHV